MTARKDYTFWVIVSGAQPTAFRAREAADLLPTLRQLQRTQPNTTMKWFERGRFWDSPEAARLAALERRHSSTGRGREWRPGGTHKDPKARFEPTRDQKRARFKRRLIADRRGPAGDREAPDGRKPGPDRRPTSTPKERPRSRSTKPKSFKPDRPQGKSGVKPKSPRSGGNRKPTGKPAGKGGRGRGPR